jgi:UDP-N-acetylmuramate-alanine ligase
MALSSAGFSSVKLPAALVQQARETAQPLRRSVAGQVEYWATLGRIVEHSGLTAQEAREAIEGYEAVARRARLAGTLDSIEAGFAAADDSGHLADRVREVVLSNRAKAVALKKAA